jgi:alpha-amylase/alpha-mannosidase (GH57 family)
MSTRLVLLLHQHQPDYRDPTTGRPRLPFARLHALRGYRDVAVAIQRWALPITLNLAPVLLEQLERLELGDDHLDLTRADDLTPSQATQLISGHPAMWRHPRARALRAQVDAGEPLDAQGLLDLQVWATLAWVGWSGLHDEPALQALRRKGSGFDRGDRAVLLERCDALAGQVLDLHRTLEHAEIITSPQTHPILPLLVDTEHARRCLADLPPLGWSFAWPGDALAQLEQGRATHERVLGKRPRGLWPSEGSVSPEVIELVSQAGYAWLATDQGILERSRTDPGDHTHTWDLGHGVAGLFRDHGLSDAIGFNFADARQDRAVAQLLAAVKRRGGTVTIALDGENPWESFADAGLGFWQALAEQLPGSGVELVTASRALELDPPTRRVHALHTGSWINADLDIWFGDDADRVAWRQLALARQACADAGDPADALEHLFAAEGSDWFWWFGPQFDTAFAGVFDGLFRDRLAACWRALGQPVPDALTRPFQIDDRVHPPTGALGTCAVGRLRAGRQTVQSGAAMAADTHGVERVRWGWADDTLHVWLDGASPAPGERWSLWLGTHHVEWSAAHQPASVTQRAHGTHVALSHPDPAQVHVVQVAADGTQTRIPSQGQLTLSRPSPQWWV